MSKSIGRAAIIIAIFGLLLGEAGLAADDADFRRIVNR